MLLIYQASFIVGADSYDDFTSIQGFNMMSNGEIALITMGDQVQSAG